MPWATVLLSLWPHLRWMPFVVPTAAFVLPKLAPGMVHVKGSVEDVPAHILRSESSKAIEKAVVSDELWPSKRAFFQLFRVQPKMLYTKVGWGRRAHG